MDAQIASRSSDSVDGPLLKPAHDAFLRGDFRGSAELVRARLTAPTTDEERRILGAFVERYRPDPVVAGIIAAALLLFASSLTLLPH